MSNSVTPWTAACQASLSFTISKNLLKFMSIGLVMLSNHLILCHPRLRLPSVFPSIRVFSSESVLHLRWPKYYSFSFSISPCTEYSGIISFSIDWFHLLAFQRTHKSLLQDHYMCVCVCVCVCVCTHICIYVRYLYVCIHINIAFISCVHIWFYIYLHIHASKVFFNTHTCMHMHI